MSEPSASARIVAVVDIGKTNAKLALHDLDTGADVFVRTLPNTVIATGPYPHFDTERLWTFILDALKEGAARHPVDAISVTTHGACAALVGEDDLVLPILDYESAAPEAERAAYDALRPPFAETFSPRLPNGLNVGAQLFWLERAFPEAFARARHVLFYPQYWVWRMTGVAATEVTSIGCHTDLWRPGEGTFSRLVADRDWRHLFPPLRSAFEPLGVLHPALAERVGLEGRRIPVHCGIHDSNASLLPHVLSTPSPFTVLSTGTWIIALGVGGRLDGLDASRDTLVNVDALGRAVPSARFMGGREFDLLTQKQAAEPSLDEVRRLIASDGMILPTFVPGTGPFPAGQGRWTVPPEILGVHGRTAAASLYCALVTDRMLRLLGADGPVMVEGPFARNALFRDALAALLARPVRLSANATGTTAGSALLAKGQALRPDGLAPPQDPEPRYRLEGLAAYAERWAERVAGTG